MRARYLLTSSLLVASLMLAACQEDPEKAANKLFVETSALLSASATVTKGDAGQIEKRQADLRQALANLDKIVAEYPESTLAVELVSLGAAKGVSRKDIEAEIAARQEELQCVAQPNRLSCIRDEAEIALNRVFAARDVTQERADEIRLNLFSNAGNPKPVMQLWGKREAEGDGFDSFLLDGALTISAANGEINSLDDFLALLGENADVDFNRSYVSVAIPRARANALIEAGRFTEAVALLDKALQDISALDNDKLKESRLNVMSDVIAKLLWEMPKEDFAAMSKDLSSKFLAALAGRSETGWPEYSYVRTLARARLGDIEANDAILKDIGSYFKILTLAKAAQLFQDQPNVLEAWTRVRNAKPQPSEIGSPEEDGVYLNAVKSAKGTIEAEAYFQDRMSVLQAAFATKAGNDSVRAAALNMRKAFMLSAMEKMPEAIAAYREASPFIGRFSETSWKNDLLGAVHTRFMATVIVDGLIPAEEILEPVYSSFGTDPLYKLGSQAATLAASGNKDKAEILMGSLVRFALDRQDDRLLWRLAKDTGVGNQVFLPKDFQVVR